MGALHQARPPCAAGVHIIAAMLLLHVACFSRVPGLGGAEHLALSLAPAQGKIKSLEQIYLFSMPVKEYQIVEHFLGPSLKDEVMKIMPVQKQTRAGQRTRFKVGRAIWEGLGQMPRCRRCMQRHGVHHVAGGGHILRGPRDRIFVMGDGVISDEG